MNKDYVPTDPPYNVYIDLGLQTSDYDLMNNENVAEMADKCHDYLKLGRHEHILGSSVPLPTFSRIVSALNKSCLSGLRGDRQEQDESSLVGTNQRLVA